MATAVRGWGAGRLRHRNTKRSTKRRLVVVFSLVVGLPALGASAPAAAAADLLPDLGMAPLTDFTLQTTSSGEKRLRFTSVIVNVGDGRFRLRGTRSSTSVSTMTTKQRIYNDAGGYYDVSTPAVMKWSGDGHNHWHTMKIQSSTLYRVLDSGETEVAAGSKQGFCFYDNYEYDLDLPGAPSWPYFTGCGKKRSLSVTMGLSVGWGDEYPWDIAYQYVKVTGLPAGTYILKVKADPSGWFKEKDTSNNETWAKLELSGSSVKVLEVGPGA